METWKSQKLQPTLNPFILLSFAFLISTSAPSNNAVYMLVVVVVLFFALALPIPHQFRLKFKPKNYHFFSSVNPRSPIPMLVTPSTE